MLAAETINDYFCRVGLELAKEIEPTTEKFPIERVTCKFKWGFPITESDTYKEIAALSKTNRLALAT